MVWASRQEDAGEEDLMPEASPQGAKMAVMFAVGAAILAAVDAVIVRALNGAVHPFVIGFFRAFFGAVILLPWVALRPSVLRSSHPLRQHAVRAGFKLLAMVAFFAAFSWGPLADVTAIAFTSPIFLLLGAADGDAGLAVANVDNEGFVGVAAAFDGEDDGGVGVERGDVGRGGEVDLPYDVKIQCGDSVIPVIAALREKNGDDAVYAPAPGSTPGCPFVIEGAVIRADEVTSCTPFTATEADAAAEGNRDAGRDRVDVTFCWYEGAFADDGDGCCILPDSEPRVVCETDHLDIRFYCDGGEGVPAGRTSRQTPPGQWPGV